MPSCPTARPNTSNLTEREADRAPGSEATEQPQRPDFLDLLDLLASIDDFRDPRGRRHTLAGVLALGLAAVIAGARSYVAIAEWADAQDTSLLTPLGVDATHGVPETSTFRRVFSGVHADRLDAALGAHLWTRTYRDSTGRKVIALDGKTVRGARTPDQSAPHLLAACDHHSGTVLGQLAVEAKTNEIPAARTLLASFDLNDSGRGVVVTVDALHTQTDTAKLIVEAGGDYVFTIKKNQPNLYRDCTRLPWSKIPTHRATDTSHGRRAIRGIKVTTVPAWIEFTGATQIAQIRRTVTRRKNGVKKKTVEVWGYLPLAGDYVLTSADHVAATPATLAGWVTAHWTIENRVHWVRDVTFDEDRSQVRTGSGPQVMATLRNTAISLLRLDGWSNIAAGLRHHARSPGALLVLLLTCTNATLP